MTGKRRVPLGASDARAQAAADLQVSSAREARRDGPVADGIQRRTRGRDRPPGAERRLARVLAERPGEEPPHDHAPGRACRRRGAGTLGEPTVSATDRWVPIGPSVVRRGQAVDRPRVSGRIRDLAVHRDGTRAYAATARGGVWYTDDGGSTWAPVGAWPSPPGSPVAPTRRRLRQHPGQLRRDGSAGLRHGRHGRDQPDRDGPWRVDLRRVACSPRSIRSGRAGGTPGRSTPVGRRPGVGERRDLPDRPAPGRAGRCERGSDPGRRRRGDDERTLCRAPAGPAGRRRTTRTTRPDGFVWTRAADVSWHG